MANSPAQSLALCMAFAAISLVCVSGQFTTVGGSARSSFSSGGGASARVSTTSSGLLGGIISEFKQEARVEGGRSASTVASSFTSGGFSDPGCPCNQDQTPPGSSLSCAQQILIDPQKRFGKCFEKWMIKGDYCSCTCGRCGKIFQQVQLKMDATGRILQVYLRSLLEEEYSRSKKIAQAKRQTC
ncbi:hypothetical protein BSKO_03150 [Bryopsis sp. KO-2023]|nr:hypothetical protein BSKO_03150 [Bryopsis sp. KO-2023]